MKKTQFFKENKYNKRILIYLSIWGITLAFIMLMPRIKIKKPVIEALEPNCVMTKCNFNDGNVVDITGANLLNCVGIYINGIWRPEVEIISEKQESMRIRLPYDIYSNPGAYDIQIQTKVNGDFFAMSKKQRFTVQDDAMLSTPEIHAAKIFDTSKFMATIRLEGENLGVDCMVYANDKKLVTEPGNNGRLLAYVPFYVLSNNQQLNIKVVKYYNGYETNVKSPTFYLDITKGWNLDGTAANHETMLEYLRRLQKTEYIVSFAANDESCCAMTWELQEAIRAFGLTESLLLSGVHNSYIAVVACDHVIYEQIGKEALTYDSAIDNQIWHIESANFDVGAASSIQISGMEYGVNGQGLNIVVYDPIHRTVVDSVCFNTYMGLDMTVKE